ncbi:ADP-ribosylglycohydrolase family protein [Porticoccus sp. GXU_MW_L64]
MQEIADGAYLSKAIDEIKGSGYVVESLVAALWCFAHTQSFDEAILTAANLGNDADTTAAICGQIAGAYYGVAGINSGWLNRLHMHQEIRDLALSLLNEHSDQMEVTHSNTDHE